MIDIDTQLQEAANRLSGETAPSQPPLSTFKSAANHTHMAAKFSALGLAGIAVAGMFALLPGRGQTTPDPTPTENSTELIAPAGAANSSAPTETTSDDDVTEDGVPQVTVPATTTLPFVAEPSEPDGIEEPDSLDEPSATVPPTDAPDDGDLDGNVIPPATNPIDPGDNSGVDGVPSDDEAPVDYVYYDDELDRWVSPGDAEWDPDRCPADDGCGTYDVAGNPVGDLDPDVRDPYVDDGINPDEVDPNEARTDDDGETPPPIDYGYYDEQAGKWLHPGDAGWNADRCEADPICGNVDEAGNFVGE